MKIAITTNTPTAIVIECLTDAGEAMNLWLRAEYGGKGTVYVDKFGQFPIPAPMVRTLAGKLLYWAEKMEAKR